MSVSDAEYLLEAPTNSRPKATACVYERRRRSPLLQPSGSWTEVASVPSVRPARLCASSTSLPSSGSGPNASKACSGSLDYSGLRGELPLSCGRCREVLSHNASLEGKSAQRTPSHAGTKQLVTLLVLYADWQRVPYFLDTALVLSLLAFIATLVLARFHGEGRVFWWPPLLSPTRSSCSACS